MKALKVLGTLLLGFLLLLSLVFLGVFFTLQSTLLNPDFVVREANKIDIPAVARELIEQQVGGQPALEEELVIEALYRVVEDQEPWLKQQLNYAIHTGYDFLLGKTDSLSISVPLRDLKQDFRDSLWETITGDLDSWLPLFQEELNVFVDQNFPALEQNIQPYLPPDLAAMPDAELRLYLDDYLLQIEGEITGQDFPPAARDLVLTVARPYFDDFYEQMVIDLPDEATLDPETIPSDVMSNLLKARGYINDFRMAYYGLIAFAVVLAGAIVLIWRRVRPACLALGLVLLIAGGLELAGVLLAGSVTLPALFAGIPPWLNTWINGLYHDVLQVLLIFSASVLGTGVVLLAVSLLYRPAHEAE